jgi:hypothetical protein
MKKTLVLLAAALLQGPADAMARRADEAPPTVISPDSTGGAVQGPTISSGPAVMDRSAAQDPALRFSTMTTSDPSLRLGTSPLPALSTATAPGVRSSTAGVSDLNERLQPAGRRPPKRTNINPEPTAPTEAAGGGERAPALTLHTLHTFVIPA